MFFSLALFLCLLLVTYRIAALMDIKHAEWVVILTGLQPILFDISYACLAETPAALLIALSYWYHLKGRRGWAMAIASGVFLFRFEMYGFAVLMFFVYLRKRDWKILPLVLLGPLFWIGSSAIISGDVMTFFREWSNFSNLGKYVSGISVTYYLEHLHTIFGYAQVVLFVVGVISIVRAKKSADFGILFSTLAINITTAVQIADTIKPTTRSRQSSLPFSRYLISTIWPRSFTGQSSRQNPPPPPAAA